MSPYRVEIFRGPSRADNESFMQTMDDLHDAKAKAQVEGFPLVGGNLAKEAGCDLMLPGIQYKELQKAEKFADEVNKKEDLIAKVVYYSEEE